MTEAHNATPLGWSKYMHNLINYMRRASLGSLLLCLAFIDFSVSCGEEPFRPQAGQFPPLEQSKAYRGELVFVDHVNRRGSLRLHVDGHYQEGRLHHFAMLPYGVIRYRGAPAELRDIPIGTVLYGRFFLPPDPQTSAVPIAKGNDVTAPAENHAILLEDGPSLCLRQGSVWRLLSVEMKRQEGVLRAKLERDEQEDGLVGEHSLTIDGSTRVWRGRELLGIDELIAEGLWPQQGKKELEGTEVHLALTWHPRYLYQEFHVSDIWLDDKSMEVAAERQRQNHIRHVKSRWMPAWVENVEYGEFGKATITARLFGGMDESLYAAFKPGVSGKMAAAEDTLRTWWPDHDGMDGRIIAVEDDQCETASSNISNPGDSGIKIRFEVSLILEGFRPGRVVRIRPSGWPNVKPPVEERVRSFEDRWPGHEIFR